MISTRVGPLGTVKPRVKRPRPRGRPGTEATVYIRTATSRWAYQSSLRSSRTTSRTGKKGVFVVSWLWTGITCYTHYTVAVNGPMEVSTPSSGVTCAISTVSFRGRESLRLSFLTVWIRRSRRQIH